MNYVPNCHKKSPNNFDDFRKHFGAVPLKIKNLQDIWKNSRASKAKKNFQFMEFENQCRVET